MCIPSLPIEDITEKEAPDILFMELINPNISDQVKYTLKYASSRSGLLDPDMVKPSKY